MRFSLVANSNNYLEVTRLVANNKFELIPNSFKHESYCPEWKSNFSKITKIEFRWIIWNFKLGIRKKT